MRSPLLILLTVAMVGRAQAEPGDRCLDEFFKGKVVDVRGSRVTLRYDFEHPDQIQDFEQVRPDGLFGKQPGEVKLEGGRLLFQRRAALLHRAVGNNYVRGRFLVQAHLKRDLGVLVSGADRFLLVDLFDHRFLNHEGLLVGMFAPGAPLKWRTLAQAKAPAVGRFFHKDKSVEVEVTSFGQDQVCRIATFHRRSSGVGKTKAMPTRRFGWWVDAGAMSIDELTLTIDLDDAYRAKHKLQLALTTDALTCETQLGRLVKQARDKPLSVGAARARRELSLRGPDGWKKLFALASSLARKTPYAAVPVVRALAAGPEPERRDHLLKLARRRYPDDLKLAILRGLLPWYADHKTLLDKGLSLRVPERVEYLRELNVAGVSSDVLKRHVDDAALSEEIYSMLRDRGEQLSADELGDLPRMRALEAHSPAAARAILEDFGTDRNWGIVLGLIHLLRDTDPKVARGAYLLLLTLSGKDLPPDPDFWRSWLAAKKGSWEPPHLSAPGVATAAILRGVEFLKKDLADDGACVWPVSPDWPGTRVGATALAIYALRAAGVPADDAAITKAVRTTLLVGQGDAAALRSDLGGYTYALSLLCLALHSVDATRYRQPLEILAKRLVHGQLENGQWTYYCHDKQYKRRPKAGDNSNTQYAILGLRAARLAGVEIEPEIWQRNAGYWIQTRNAWGGWGYGPSGTTQHELSMTSAGVATYAICMEALHNTDAVQRVRNSKRVKLGMQRLGELLLVKRYKGEEIYAMYGVERACILTGIRAFNEFDWYREGAGDLVATQKESGAWGDPEARGVTTGRGYGEAIDTAYALLFLKRATTGLPGAGGGGVVKVKYIRPQTVEKPK